MSATATRRAADEAGRRNRPPEGFDREVGPGGLEARTTPLPDRVEARASGDGTKRIVGLGSVSDQTTRIEGLFREWDEEVAPGAWTKTIAESKRIVSTLNHDTGRLLGSTDAGTLKLSEPDGKDLEYDVEVNPDDPLALSAHAQVARGDVNGSSVWFRVVRQEWTYPTEENGLEVPKRRILEGQLFETGPVVFPAFPQTTAGARSIALIDAALRAAHVPDEQRDELARAAAVDPERFEAELTKLLDRDPELRDAVCACSAPATRSTLLGDDAKSGDVAREVWERFGLASVAPEALAEAGLKVDVRDDGTVLLAEDDDVRHDEGDEGRAEHDSPDPQHDAPGREAHPSIEQYERRAAGIAAMFGLEG